MRFPQVLVYEPDGRLAKLLRDAIDERKLKWALREPRRPEACLRLLQRGGPGVLVVKVQRPQVRQREMLEELTQAYKQLATQRRHLAQQMALVEQVHWLFPETAVVVAGDTEDVALSDLAWDLGAQCVLFPPLSREYLVDVVAGLMEPILPILPDAGPELELSDDAAD